jgi:hypothetical protein
MLADGAGTDDVPVTRRVCVDTYERLAGRSLYGAAAGEEQAADADEFSVAPLFVGHVHAEQLTQMVELLDPFRYNRGSW